MQNSYIQQIAKGEKSAVEACLNAYGGLVWSIAKRWTSSTEDAEDAVQDIFLEVWKNAAKYDPNVASEATFIATIARRRLIDRFRYEKRRISAEHIDDLTLEPADNQHKIIATSVEAAEAAKALQFIRPEQQQILKLSIIDGYSHQEISDRLKMPLGTVKTHARRGLAQVREILGIGRTEASQ